MKSLIQEIFPTELYIFDFNEDEIQPVIDIANKIEPIDFEIRPKSGFRRG